MPILVFVHEEASAKLTPLEPNVYILSNVWSKTRRRGYATGVMRKVVKHADENNLILVLRVQRYGSPHQPAMNNHQLERFYAHFGFVKDPDPEERRAPVFMRRVPSRVLHSP